MDIQVVSNFLLIQTICSEQYIKQHPLQSLLPSFSNLIIFFHSTCQHPLRVTISCIMQTGTLPRAEAGAIDSYNEDVNVTIPGNWDAWSSYLTYYVCVTCMFCLSSAQNISSWWVKASLFCSLLFLHCLEQDLECSKSSLSMWRMNK